jgi:lactoylglutathione lyase
MKETNVMQQNGVRELRLVVTTEDYERALHFYRDVLGLKERAAFASEGGHVTILEAGRATLELTDSRHAEFIDNVEVGRRVAGHVRVAFEVDDSAASTRALEAAGATVLAEPTRTPWNSLNARLQGPAGLQLTLFTELSSPSERSASRPGSETSLPTNTIVPLGD